jgi:sugar lactone lactonase YvrE
MVTIPIQSVPTSVVVGPDGAYYVGELTGGPFPIGGASVLRVVPGEEPTVYATGFTNIIDLGFAPDGTLYVAEIVHDGLMGLFAGDAPPIGAVLSVPPGGGDPTVVATGEQVMAPGGLAVDADGSVYVTTGTVMGPGAGAVIKITP